MSAADRAKWDARYAAATVATEPVIDPWFAAQVEPLPPRRALDVACGLGHDAVWLAERGWQVTAVDVSPIGLARAAELARRRGVTVDWQTADLDEFVPPAAEFGLITVCRFLDRDRLPSRLTSTLTPGGRLIYRTFCASPTGSTTHSPAFVLQPGELPRLFPHLATVSYDETFSGAEYYARFVGLRK
jgi:2-polyprenyl-3-methyl-5-hydroxy-6-metoxy-1,4-benzoquinol methylase